MEILSLSSFFGKLEYSEISQSLSGLKEKWVEWTRTDEATAFTDTHVFQCQLFQIRSYPSDESVPRNYDITS